MLSIALAASSLGRAQLVGTVYENTKYSGDADEGPSFDPGYYASLPSAQFDTGAINYQSQIGGYTVGGFLNNPTFFNLMNGFNPAASDDNSFVTITGLIYLNSGANSFVVAHDDGISIYIDGIGSAIDQPGPTAEDFSPFTVTAPSAGDYTFSLNYTECCGPPADLVWEIDQKVVGGAPDAASGLLLLSLGVGSLAIVSRKLMAKAA